MRGFAEAYPEPTIVKQLVSQLPWGHVVRLLQRVKNADERHWYMQQTITQGWSRSLLNVQLDRRVHKRQGRAQNNFALTLPPADSDLAAQTFKDPYLFDFLGTANLRREAEVEQALIEHIQRFLLELGTGFAFVGRQVALEVGKQDFKIDLLFYHFGLRCFVVVELKAVDFEPSLSSAGVIVSPEILLSAMAVAVSAHPMFPMFAGIVFVIPKIVLFLVPVPTESVLHFSSPCLYIGVPSAEVG